MLSKVDSNPTNFLDYFADSSIQYPPIGKGLRSFSKLLEYNISDLCTSSISEHKKRLYQLATFADMSKIQIHFQGLEKLTKKYELLFGCTWKLEEDYPREKEFFDLLNMIQSQSSLSSRKFDIKLVE